MSKNRVSMRASVDVPAWTFYDLNAYRNWKKRIVLLPKDYLSTFRVRRRRRN